MRFYLMLEASVMVPGSCGELIQGVIDNKNFLITCPVDIYSKVTVKLSREFDFNISNIKAEKTLLAVKEILHYFGEKDLGAMVKIESQLLRGKGMASSTADIAAALGAVMLALGYEIDIKLIKKIALNIEPTDGTFLPGIHLFDHINGDLLEYLGEPPEMEVIILSEPGEVDTLAFNARDDLYKFNLEKEKYLKEALALFKDGMKYKDRYMIGKAATMSSLAHQKILYKPHLDKLLDLSMTYSWIYGVNIAHSGTSMGLLIKPDVSEEKINKLINEAREMEFIKRTRLISGGLKIINGSR
jgi:L-threonine kinase